jgi:hypothetical protein
MIEKCLLIPVFLSLFFSRLSLMLIILYFLLCSTLGFAGFLS